MSNRVIKDSIWTSKKLARCSINTQLHYPRLYLLVDDYSCFEIDSEVIKGLAYPKLKIDCSQIEAFLNELEANGLLFSWQQNGTSYGYFTGEEEGRLPPPSRRHKRQTPEPPKKELTAYLKKFSNLQVLPTEAYKEGSKRVQEGSKGIQDDFPNLNPNLNPKHNPNPSKDSRKKDFATCDSKLTDFLIEGIKSNDPKAKVPKKDTPEYEKWVNQIRLCRKRDERTEEEIKAMIIFSQNDDFWRGNILSTAKLRKQIPQLLLQSKRQKEPKASQVGRTNIKPEDRLDPKKMKLLTCRRCSPPTTFDSQKMGTSCPICGEEV